MTVSPTTATPATGTRGTVRTPLSVPGACGCGSGCSCGCQSGGSCQCGGSCG
ncbi:hypothetical protein [Streptomyces zingiberis]|uniref:Metallothionein n=1 Tax=Streptomyces zingiberis TaxID=2053010 RepID=A0ABX1BX25_9ACTN|nr:hypothetical protein [Streptomyces zingiberis]NJQ00027.1 hypothetical protein [Streptomyces zingiberis]